MLNLLVMILLLSASRTQGIDCNACSYSCGWTDLSCPGKKFLCQQTKDLFFTSVNLVVRSCANDAGRMGKRELVEAAKSQLFRNGLATRKEFDGVQIRFCFAIALGAGMVPRKDLILLTNNAKSASPVSLAVLLAHELVHIRQFRSMGSDKFGCEYGHEIFEGRGTGESNRLEKEAYSFQDRAFHVLTSQSIFQRFVGGPSCIPVGNDVVHCFVRRAGGALLQKERYQPWHSLAGVLTSDPECLLLGNQRQCFARGTDGGLYQIWSGPDGASWSHWTSQGGTFPKQRPRCVAAASNLLCFVRGMDQALWVRQWSGSSWKPWKSLGGIITSDPECFTHGHQIHCFCRGSDHALWQIWTESPTATWSGWIGHGGQFSEQRPNCVSVGGMVRCFVRGTDNALWLREWSGNAWAPWKSLGGVLTSNPECISHSGKTHCFCRGTDAALWQIWSESPEAAWGNWIGLGGTFPPQQPHCLFVGANPWCFVRGTDDTLFVRRWDGGSHAWFDWHRFH